MTAGDVYVASATSNAVARFARAADGSLTELGAVSGASLRGATGVAATADRVYVAARGGTLSVLSRDLERLGTLPQRAPAAVAAFGANLYAGGAGLRVFGP